MAELDVLLLNMSLVRLNNLRLLIKYANLHILLFNEFDAFL